MRQSEEGDDAPQSDCSQTVSGAARGWHLSITGGGPSTMANNDPLANGCDDIEERERRVGIVTGMPILVSGDEVDDRLNVYFRQAFPRDRMATANTYAIELRTWLAFLKTQDVKWDEARREDVRTFQMWRVYDERNVGRVTPATWNKGWAALRHFYNWAQIENWIERSPVGDHDRLRDPSHAGGHREKNARASRDRWLTPGEFAMWREVGLRGYRAIKQETGKIVAGLPDETFRGRNTARNAAFANYVLSTGLRESEAGMLLTMEIPAGTGDKAPIVGKGGVFRHYMPLHSSGPDSLQAYIAGERRDVIERSQRSHRYQALTNRIDVAEVLPSARRGQRVRLNNGRIADVAMMSKEDRGRLYIPGAEGLEPAALWLTESGTPMPPATWNAVFNTANARVSAVRSYLGSNSPWVHVTPHSLRFTFSLMVLVAGVRATDEHIGIGPADPFLVGNYSHVFDEVRDLLGHSSVETTKRIYLEPVKGLRRSSLFRGNTLDEIWDGISAASALVGFEKLP